MPWATIQSPSDEPEHPERVPDPGRWEVAGRGQVGWRRPDIADDDEQEGQADRDRGADDVDRQWQPAGVGRVEPVGGDVAGTSQGDRAGAEGARDPGRERRDPGPSAADHASSVGRVRRVRR